jgi:16S rRNA (guanine527-N7)-methyltransferase
MSPLDSSEPVQESASVAVTGALLEQLAQQYGLQVTSQQAVILAAYLQRLQYWNQRLNLTRHDQPELFVTRDLLDSLRLVAHLPQGAKVLDVGSGGGVPGLIVAILRPDLTVSVCDSVGKKAAALQDIVSSLGLAVQVYGKRVQDVLPQQRIQIVTARAVGAIDKLLPWFDSLWAQGAEVLLIKGPRWQDELAEAQQSGTARGRRIERIASWHTAGRDCESVLLRIR